MTDIPEDIFAKARTLADDAGTFGYTQAALDIAHALLAERNRASPPEGRQDGGVTVKALDLLASLDPDALNPEQFNAWCALTSALAQPEAPASLAKEGLSVTEAFVKDATTEYLSHRGERPYRILCGGQELWETHAPAIRAALTAALAPGSASLAEDHDTMQPDKYDGGNFNGLVQGEDNDPEASHG